MVHANNQELKEVTSDMSASMSTAIASNENFIETNTGSPAAIQIRNRHDSPSSLFILFYFILLYSGDVGTYTRGHSYTPAKKQKSATLLASLENFTQACHNLLALPIYIVNVVGYWSI